MSKAFKLGVVVFGLFLSLMFTGLVASVGGPVLIGIGLYELLSIKRSSFLAVLIPLLLVLVYQYIVDLLAGGMPRFL